VAPVRQEMPTPTPSEPLRQTAPSGSVTVALPTIGDSNRAAADSVPAPAEPGKSIPPSLPWVLAAIAAIGGAAFFFYRRRLSLAASGGPELDAYVAPTPDPPKSPQVKWLPPPGSEEPPIEDKNPIPALGGLVSTRLRPWMALDFRPIGCSVDDEKVVIDFEIEALNQGNAPARAVLIEARLVNAGADQDSEIGSFYANPVGMGDRIPLVEPMKRVQLRSQLVATRDQLQIYKVGDRSVFVPLVAFNILYEWARGHGQTSASYLVGRDTKGEKLAPFRVDLGPRMFRSLDKRLLPLEVRH